MKRLSLFFIFVVFSETSFAEDLNVYEVKPLRDYSWTLGLGALTVIEYTHPEWFIQTQCPCDPNMVNALDRPAIYNDRLEYYALANDLVFGSLFIPIIADAIDLKASSDWADDVAVYLQTLAVDQALVTSLKLAFQRPFPHRYLTTNTATPVAGDFLAFPSGHTSTVSSLLTAAAWTYHYRYGFSIWPWVADAVLTTATGAALVYSGEHFTTDVIAGGVIGVGIGTLVPYLHRIKKSTGLMVTLLLSQNGIYTSVGYSF